MSQNLDRDDELQKWRWRYAQREKEGKSRLLDEFCEQYGFSRKHAIKLLRDQLPQASGQPHPGPQPRYGPVAEVVERIWRVAEQLCGKRLARALPLWLPHYEGHYGKLLPTQKKLLTQISAATLDRLLIEQKAKANKGLGGTKPGSLLRQHVPIQGEVWDESRLGFLEA